VLTAWHERQTKPGHDALVFLGLTGERMTRIDTSWESRMKLAGIRNFRFHDWRHHFRLQAHAGRGGSLHRQGTARAR
jgi:integrase